MAQPSITCPACKGKGKVSLPSHLQQTLKALHPGKDYRAEDVFELLDPRSRPKTINSINLRLEQLRRLGLVDRLGTRRQYVYSRA